MENTNAPTNPNHAARAAQRKLERLDAELPSLRAESGRARARRTGVDVDVKDLPVDLDGDRYRNDELGPWKVSPCCGSYATGVEHGVVCKGCFELIDYADGPARLADDDDDRCPKCDSKDVGVYAASEAREDCGDLLECHACGLTDHPLTDEGRAAVSSTVGKGDELSEVELNALSAAIDGYADVIYDTASEPGQVDELAALATAAAKIGAPTLASHWSAKVDELRAAIRKCREPRA